MRLWWFRVGRRPALLFGGYMSSEILARLNPLSVHFGGTGGGGWGEFTPLDVAAALGMGNLSRLGYLLALAKFAGYSDVMPELYKRAYGEIWETFYKEGRQQTDRFDNLIKTAVDDVIDWHVCPKCLGIGEARAPKVKGLIKCKKCDGSGKVFPSNRELAKRCQIPKTTFINKYREPYDRMIKQLEDVVIEIELHLKRYYFKNDENI